MTDDLDSSSRGIWVFPHDPTLESVAGPSKPTPRQKHPLGDIYSSSLEAYRSAYEEYEDKRTEEQLDDITDWLDHATSSASNSRYHRLPVGVLQNPAKQVHGQIRTINTSLKVISLQGRDIVDVGSGIRAITAGIIGEVPKTGLTGLDLVDQLYSDKSRSASPTLVLHIQDAQVVPPPVLAEIMYIICLHSLLPIRLLLSAPSASTFLSQWQMLEPSSIDLTILSSRGRRKQTALGAMLESGGKNAQITVGEELAEALRADEGMYGQGPEGALKAIQWSMLHHSVNSPLASLNPDDSADQEKLKTVRAMLESMRSDTTIPGHDLFQLPAYGDLNNVMDPAPRISILQALCAPSLFTDRLPPAVPAEHHDNGHITAHPASGSAAAASPKTTPRKTSKRRKPSPSPSPIPVEIAGNALDSAKVENGDLKDLEILFGLWKGAGKNVNLWDWLQGYKGSMARDTDPEPDVDVDGNTTPEPGVDADMVVEAEANGVADEEAGPGKKRRRQGNDAHEKEVIGPAVDEDRLHATFVRFCEEARMLGLVRARGKAAGRKADEVVKGVTLV